MVVFSLSVLPGVLSWIFSLGASASSRPLPLKSWIGLGESKGSVSGAGDASDVVSPSVTIIATPSDVVLLLRVVVSILDDVPSVDVFVGFAVVVLVAAVLVVDVVFVVVVAFVVIIGVFVDEVSSRVVFNPTSLGVLLFLVLIILLCSSRSLVESEAEPEMFQVDENQKVAAMLIDLPRLKGYD